MCANDASGMVNCVDPYQIAPVGLGLPCVLRPTYHSTSSFYREEVGNEKEEIGSQILKMFSVMDEHVSLLASLVNSINFVAV